MEKKIVLTMLPSKDIDVTLDENSRMTIKKDNRAVSADAIYNLLGYENGDTFVVESVNDKRLDTPVLQFFTELIRDITNRLNRLSENWSDDEDESNFVDMGDNGIFPDGEDFPFL